MKRVMQKYIWYLLLTGCLIICIFSPAIMAEAIRFTAIDYCPFTCDPLQEDGKEGFMTDVLREAFEQAGHTVEVEMYPYLRAVKYVQDGKYDGIAVVSKDYAPDLVYPDIPTVVQRVAFLVNTGTSWRYTGVDSLSQVIVGIVRGYHYVDADLVSYLEEERSNPDRVHVLYGDDTVKRGMQMLQSHRIDTFLEGEFSAKYMLGKMGLQDAVTIAGYTVEAFQDYTGFSPHHQKAAQYARILSDTIVELQQSGRLGEILRRYGITSEQTL